MSSFYITNAKATHIFSAKIPVNPILYILKRLIFWLLTSLLSYQCFEQLGLDIFILECCCTIFTLSTYMPYLTLWDKISPNLAHLDGNSHKKFRSQNFQTILQQILDYFGGALMWCLRNLAEFRQISLKILPYLTDFSPQFMACM